MRGQYFYQATRTEDVWSEYIKGIKDNDSDEMYRSLRKHISVLAVTVAALEPRSDIDAFVETLNVQQLEAIIISDHWCNETNVINIDDILKYTNAELLNKCLDLKLEIEKMSYVLTNDHKDKLTDYINALIDPVTTISKLNFIRIKISARKSISNKVREAEGYLDNLRRIDNLL